MTVPIVGSSIDERFLAHRLKSTSAGGMIGGAVAMGLFVYRHYANHIWSWDLLAVGVTIAGVKVALMIWYHFND